MDYEKLPAIVSYCFLLLFSVMPVANLHHYAVLFITLPRKIPAAEYIYEKLLMAYWSVDLFLISGSCINMAHTDY